MISLPQFARSDYQLIFR